MRVNQVMGIPEQESAFPGELPGSLNLGPGPLEAVGGMGAFQVVRALPTPIACQTQHELGHPPALQGSRFPICQMGMRASIWKVLVRIK